MFKIKRDEMENVVAEFQDSEGRYCRIDFFGEDGCQMDIGDGYAVFDASDAVKLAELIIERLS